MFSKTIYEDKQPLSGDSYYRLRQFDTDNSNTYSKVISVYRKPIALSFSIYPNPVKDGLFIDYSDGMSGDLQCIIYNTLGQKVHSINWTIPTNEQLIIPVSQLNDGGYFIQLINGELRETIEFLKY